MTSEPSPSERVSTRLNVIQRTEIEETGGLSAYGIQTNLIEEQEGDSLVPGIEMLLEETQNPRNCMASSMLNNDPDIVSAQTASASGSISKRSRKGRRRKKHAGEADSCSSNFVKKHTPSMTLLAKGPMQKSSGNFIQLLATLSEDAICVVIRQMSRRPISNNWQASIPVKTSRMLLSDPGDVHNVARQMFNGLQISTKGNIAHNGKWHNPSILWDADAPSVVNAVGSNLTSLHLCSGTLQPGPAESGLVQSIKKSCTNLVHLSISGIKSDELFEALLATRSCSLRTLEFDCLHSSKRIDSLERHGIGLKKLLIRRPASSISSAVHILAPSLRDLTLLFVFRNVSFPGLFDKVRENCKKLSIFKHRGEPISSFASLAELLASCGARLKSTNLSGAMRPDLLRKISESNVNVRVNLRTNALNVSQALHALGDRVERLEISYDIPQQPHMIHDLAELRSAADTCPSLETLALRDVKPELAPAVLEAVLGAAKQELRVLVISTKEFSQTILDAVAKYTGCLMTVKLITGLPTAGAFKKLVRANSTLQRVTIRIRESKPVWMVPNAAETAIDILRTFCPCAPDLREITLHWGEESDVYRRGKLPFEKRIANACVPLRPRRLLIHIFGHDYKAC